MMQGESVWFQIFLASNVNSNGKITIAKSSVGNNIGEKQFATLVLFIALSFDFSASLSKFSLLLPVSIEAFYEANKRGSSSLHKKAARRSKVQ